MQPLWIITFYAVIWYECIITFYVKKHAFDHVLGMCSLRLQQPSAAFMSPLTTWFHAAGPFPLPDFLLPKPSNSARFSVRWAWWHARRWTREITAGACTMRGNKMQPSAAFLWLRKAAEGCLLLPLNVQHSPFNWAPSSRSHVPNSNAPQSSGARRRLRPVHRCRWNC